jgi:hypothetical protein
MNSCAAWGTLAPRIREFRKLNPTASMRWTNRISSRTAILALKGRDPNTARYVDRGGFCGGGETGEVGSRDPSRELHRVPSLATCTLLESTHARARSDSAAVIEPLYGANSTN